MERLYGMDLPSKKGKILCKKCHTYYDERPGKQKCPWCDTMKPDPEKSETAKGGEPTQVDKDLFEFMKGATLEQKTKIMKFIEDEL